MDLQLWPYCVYTELNWEYYAAAANLACRNTGRKATKMSCFDAVSKESWDKFIQVVAKVLFQKRRLLMLGDM